MYEDMQERREENHVREIKSQTNSNRFFVAGTILLGVVLWLVGKVTGVQAIIIIAVGLLLITYVSQQERKRNKELTMQEVRMRIHRQLEEENKHPISTIPGLPQGPFQVSMFGRRQTGEGKALRYVIGVTIIEKHFHTKEHVLVEADVYTGNITGVRKMPFGYDGSEATDIKYIPHPVDRSQKKRNDYLGGKKKK